MVLALFVVALTSIPALANECVQPEACSSLAAKAAAKSGAVDPADYIKTWTFVNCDAQGYFVGAMQNYQSCLATKAVEDKKLQDEANKKREEAKKAGKSYTTKKEFGKDVKAGDILKAARNETIVITYADGAEIRLLPGATMKLTSYETVDLIRGKAMFMVDFARWQANKIKRKFEVRTSGGAGAVRGTKFQVNATAVSTNFRVIEGAVEVSNLKKDKAVEVNAGFSAVIRKNGNISKPKPLDQKTLNELSGLAAEIK